MLINNYKNALFLINPVAGKLPIKKKITLINNVIKNYKSEILITRSPEESAQRTKEAMLDDRLVVACGGDGLQNIVAEQAVNTGGTMAVFPMGRGNDFAASLKIHNSKDLETSLSSNIIHKARYLNVEFEGYEKHFQPINLSNTTAPIKNLRKPDKCTVYWFHGDRAGQTEIVPDWFLKVLSRS